MDCSEVEIVHQWWLKPKEAFQSIFSYEEQPHESNAFFGYTDCTLSKFKIDEEKWLTTLIMLVHKNDDKNRNVTVSKGSVIIRNSESQKFVKEVIQVEFKWFA